MDDSKVSTNDLKHYEILLLPCIDAFLNFISLFYFYGNIKTYYYTGSYDEYLKIKISMRSVII